MQTLMSSPVKTNFPCKICNHEIIFDIQDPKSYLSKTTKEKFFGMELSTYRVLHDSSEESHFNTIIVDHMGYFRGYIDSYTEKHTQERDSTEFTLIGTVYNNNYTQLNVNSLLMFNLNERWALDIINPATAINLRNLMSLLIDKITEANAIYTKSPEELLVTLADKKFYICNFESNYIALSFRDDKDESTQILKQVFKEVLKKRYSMNEALPVKRAFFTVIQLLDQYKSDIKLSDASKIARIITDDLLHSQIKIKDEFIAYLPRIKQRLVSEFKISEKILDAIFYGETVIFEQIQYCSIAQCRTLIDVVDFINRRNLLG